jgi:hypothetical protein
MATSEAFRWRWRSVFGEGDRDVDGEGVGACTSRRRFRSSIDLRCCSCAARASERASSRSASYGPTTSCTQSSSSSSRTTTFQLSIHGRGVSFSRGYTRRRKESLGGDVPKESEQLSLHLVDLAELKQALADDLPALVRVGVVHRDFAAEHQGREEEAMRRSRSTASGGIPLLEAGQEQERLVGDGDRKASAVQRVGLYAREGQSHVSTGTGVSECAGASDAR